MRHFALPFGLLCGFALGAIVSSTSGSPIQPTQAQDGVAPMASQTDMYKVTFSSADHSMGVGPIDSSQPLASIIVGNGSDYPLLLKTWDFTFRIPGEISAWVSFNGIPPAYRLLFTAPPGMRSVRTFPLPAWGMIPPHTQARIDLFAEIPNAPQGKTPCATELTSVEFVLGPWSCMRVVEVCCRGWTVP